MFYIIRFAAYSAAAIRCTATFTKHDFSPFRWFTHVIVYTKGIDRTMGINIYVKPTGSAVLVISDGRTVRHYTDIDCVVYHIAKWIVRERTLTISDFERNLNAHGFQSTSQLRGYYRVERRPAWRCAIQ